MADQEQLDILKQGVEAWNRWREGHANTWLDLSGANLRLAKLDGASLVGADLSGADLSGADLSGADLYRAYLVSADLTITNFERANLCKATLSHVQSSQVLEDAYTVYELNRYTGANFLSTNFYQADLSGADLSYTNFNEANLREATLEAAKLSATSLSGADLSKARIGGTIFDRVNLRLVKGLETISHGSPSTIGTNTLELSEGDIPEIFLRGVGLSDAFIAYVRSLIQSPIQYYTCFISVRLVSPKRAKAWGWAGKEYSFHN